MRVARRRWFHDATLALVVLATTARLDAVPLAAAQDDWSVEGPGRRPGRPSRPTRPPAARPTRPPATRPTRPPATRPTRPTPPPREPSSPPETPPGAAPPGAPSRTQVLIDRYLPILLRRPAEGFALTRLMDLYRERDGNIDGLVTDLRQRAAADAQAFAPRLLLGHVLAASGQHDAARAAFAEAAALRPQDSGPVVASAALARRAGQTAEARRLYQQALAQTRDTTARQDVLRALGEMALDANEIDAAAAFYEQLWRLTPESAYARQELARALVERRMFARAVEELSGLARALRGDARVLAPILRDLGRAQLELGRDQEALETLRRALSSAGNAAGIRAEVYETIVEVHRRSGRLRELADEMRAARAQSFEETALLGRLLDEIGDETEALATYRRALARNPRHLETRLRVIQLLSRSGRVAEVVAEYRALLRASPGEPRYVIELAQLLVQTGEREEALRLLADASRRAGADASMHEALAEVYTRLGEAQLAQREVELLVRIDPDDPAHLVALGEQLLDAGHRERALAVWRRILGGRDRAEAHATLAGVYADHDMLVEATEEYRRAVELDPDDIEHQRGLASVLERRRELAAAIVAWQRVLELAGRDRAARREARRRIVSIWGLERSLRTRIAELRSRFGATPPDIEAGRFLAEALLRSRQLSEARDVLERITRAEPGDIESLTTLEQVHVQTGNLPAAIDVLRRLAEAEPRRARDYYQRMAQHALALYRDAEAVQYAERAVSLAPDDARAHVRLGDLYRARQDSERAITSYRRALELDDRLFPTYFDLSEMLLAQNQTREADSLLRRVIATSPDDDLVARAARLSFQLNLASSTLTDLERTLLPLALANPQRPLFRRLVVELYSALAWPLVQQIRHGSGTEARTAREELRRMGTRAFKPLLEALGDTDPAQRTVAIEILGYLGNPNAAPPLLAAAQAEGDLELRARALLAAGSVAPAALLPRFAGLAENGDRTLRMLAIWSMGRIGGRSAAPLVRARLGDPDPECRAMAAFVLGHLGDISSAARLVGLLSSERAPQAVAAAAWALGRMRHQAASSALVSLVRTGTGGAPARAAAFALGRIADADVTDSLAAALFEPDPLLRATAASALASIGATRSSDAEAGVLPEPGTQPSAERFLLTLTPEPDHTALARVLPARATAIERAARDALQTSPERVRAVLDALTRDAERPSLAPFTDAHEGVDEPTRDAARTAAAGIAVALAPQLAQLGDHADPSIRGLALAALARVATTDDSAARSTASAALVAALDDREPRVVSAALEALALSRVPEAVPSLARLSRTATDWAVRVRVARVLGAIGTEDVVEPLARLLTTDAFAFVRHAAAEALGQSGRARAAGALETAASRDSEPAVREAATAAIAHLRAAP